jgi:hypothetical protein
MGVLRGIFGPKREEVAGGWRRRHNEEPNIVRMIKPGMGWVEHVARLGGDEKCVTLLSQRT